MNNRRNRRTNTRPADDLAAVPVAVPVPDDWPTLEPWPNFGPDDWGILPDDWGPLLDDWPVFVWKPPRPVTPCKVELTAVILYKFRT